MKKSVGGGPLEGQGSKTTKVTLPPFALTQEHANSTYTLLIPPESASIYSTLQPRKSRKLLIGCQELLISLTRNSWKE